MEPKKMTVLQLNRSTKAVRETVLPESMARLFLSRNHFKNGGLYLEPHEFAFYFKGVEMPGSSSENPNNSTPSVTASFDTEVKPEKIKEQSSDKGLQFDLGGGLSSNVPAKYVKETNSVQLITEPPFVETAAEKPKQTRKRKPKTTI